MSIVSGSICCKSCGASCSSTNRFCPTCGGSLLPVASCPNCGSKCSPGDRLCRRCSKALSMPRPSAVSADGDIAGVAPPTSNQKTLVDWLTLGAGFALLALCAQCRRGTAEMPSSLIPLGIAVGIVIITCIIGAVVSIVWNRIAGQTWAGGLTIIATTLVLGIRWLSMPFLGVTTYSLGNGLMISEVTPGSSASHDGIHSGQVILSVDGRSLTNSDDLKTYIRSRHVFDTIRLRVAIPPSTVVYQDITLGDQ